jgi:hypothetical protein
LFPQLLRFAFNSSAIVWLALQTQVNAKTIFCSLGVNVDEHRQHVVSAIPAISKLNFIKSFWQMLDVEFTLTIWLNGNDFGLSFPFLDWGQ